MANQISPPSAQPPVGQTDEQRIAEQRLVDLQKQASDAASETLKARSDRDAIKGDLDRANVELAGLRENNARLLQQIETLGKSAALKDSLTPLPVELPKGSGQLIESVTFAASGEGGAPVRANGRRGDVVAVGKAEDAAELQERVGQVARVYAVSRETFRELGDLKHLA